MHGVSIIICCHNSERRIADVLSHLQLQKFDRKVDWEIIVVDNASTDNTGITVMQVWDKKPLTFLKVVNERKPGLIYARLTGVLEAQYDIISFIDDDNWVEPRWIEKVFAIFEKDTMIGACGGKPFAGFEKDAPAWFTEFQGNFAIGDQQEESGYVNKSRSFLWGAGLSVRKSLFQEIQKKGYRWTMTGRKGNLLLAGDDSEICKAVLLMGYKLYYQKDLTLVHYMPEERLTDKKLTRMNYGFGLGLPYLFLFDVKIKRKKFYLVEFGKLIVWAVMSFIRNIVSKRKSLKKKVDQSYINGVFLGIIFFLPRIASHYKNISKLSNNGKQ
jgi:glycosyltransferase involved in cell wall biosynthesis